MPAEPGSSGRRMLSIVDEKKLRRILGGCSTRTSSSALMAFGRSRAITSSTRSSSTSAGRSSGWIRAGGFGHRDVRRQLQLARPGVDAGELADLYARCSGSPPITGTASRSSAPPAREADEPLRSGPRDWRSGSSGLSRATRGDGGRCTAARRSSRPTRTGGTTSSSTSTSTATTAQASARATRRAGPAPSPDIQGNGLLTEDLLYAPDLEQRVMGAGKR